MTIKILMPSLSPTMIEGNLTKWHIKEGDNVTAGDVIAEIETDKATMEIESVDEGEILELLFSDGDRKLIYILRTPLKSSLITALIRIFAEESLVLMVSGSNEIDLMTGGVLSEIDTTCNFSCPKFEVTSLLLL